MSERQPTLVALAEEANVSFVDLQFVDIHGALKSVSVPVQRLRRLQGHLEWFDGSALEGFARMSENDMYLKPDLSTFAVPPWDDSGDPAARVLCDIYLPNGERSGSDPRFILDQVLQEAAGMGFAYRVGPELEFFLFQRGAHPPLQTATHDEAGYFDLSTDIDHARRREIAVELMKMGVEVDASHHEVATGQHEVDLGHMAPMKAADAVVTLKWGARAIARRHGLLASFMPKPIFGANGSGMHVHQTLEALNSGMSLFEDPGDPYGLSRVARHFIAGQLAHAAGMCAVLAPLVNSYKRLVTGYEAPVYMNWARSNRSALIRVPEAQRGDMATTRVELRMPDPSCNPYLAFAVMLKAGLDGIVQELPLPEPVEEALYAIEPARFTKFVTGSLPSNLSLALDELENDSVMAETFGTQLLERFVEAKRIEWEQYRVQVTQWELDRYLLTN